MHWTTEQDRILKIWAGRVPVKLVADFVGKSVGAVSVYASKRAISLSFYGSCKNKKNIKDIPRAERYAKRKEEAAKARLKQTSSQALINSIFK